MNKALRVFGVFVLLHALAWLGTHIYRTANPSTVLVVADTSFSLKPNFPDMQRWIQQRADTGRYESLLIGTDKALIGPFEDIRSPESIFRTAFGRSNADAFMKYQSVDADRRILLSDGTVSPSGWQLVTFD